MLYTPFFLGIVVQLVRAPPCQGGSCGFEPRQSRRNGSKNISFFWEKRKKGMNKISFSIKNSYFLKQIDKFSLLQLDQLMGYRYISSNILNILFIYSGFKEKPYWVKKFLFCTLEKGIQL